MTPDRYSRCWIGVNRFTPSASRLSLKSPPLSSQRGPCFTEAKYLAQRSGGWPMQQLLWQYYESRVLQLHEHSAAAVDALPALMQKYRDTPMDLADASLVMAADELARTRIFTLDKHFHAYRNQHGMAFEVIP